MSENKGYISSSDESGSVNISEEVVAVIAASAASEIDGVGGMVSSHGRELVDMLGKKSFARGVKVVCEDKKLLIDVFLLASLGCSVNEMAAAVQSAVKAAVEDATGLEVSAVNVNVCGIGLRKSR